MDMIRSLLFTIAFFVTLQAGATLHIQRLDDDWQFREAKKVAWHKASVPGTVHTDLMANGLINDPFLGQNEREVQWVDKEDWVYQTTFDLDEVSVKRLNTNLVFDGLDTYADVYLNDSLILKANNMFRQWVVPVKDALKPKKNKLEIYFHSPIKVDVPKFDALPFKYDAVNDQSENGGILDKRVSIFARKAGYHYGWDWGPRLVTSGIWRDVYLEAWDRYKFDDISFRTLSLSKGRASMIANIDVFSDLETHEAQIVITSESKLIASRRVSLKKGLNDIEVPFKLKNPKLWWCRGMGSQNIYDFKVELLVNGEVVCSDNRQTGVRKIDVVRDEDKDGKTFYFKINGEPVFAKGANYIPCDNFLPRVTRDIYRKTIKDAADANMNMLRVWGGGIYEDDYFYHLCDSLGIMVWQDFMFACSLYPGEGEMLENIKEEATYNVKRLRNHPSIALWCGNNECLEAWYNWGLKSRYEKEGYADIIWKQYEDLFHKLLPAIISEYSPDTFYWPSSPFSRYEGASEPNNGDYHLWSVWGGSQPIDTYNQIRSRFFSEYGFQSFPEFESVIKYAPDSTEHYIDSDVMLSHQRAGADANRRIERYLLDSYPQPNDFKSFLYMTQILQGDAIKTAIEAHRRDKPYCMGSLFWQHNDCWPVASWSSRDCYGNWKAQHYFAKKAYRDIMVSVRPENDSIRIYVVSDRLKKSDGKLTMSATTMNGQEITGLSIPLTVARQGVESVILPQDELFKNENLSNVILYVTYKSDNEVYEDIYFPLPQKSMEFMKPEVVVDVVGDNGNYVVNVSSETFVRAFRVSIPDDDYFFEDNYFDLIPGKKYSVRLKSNLSANEIMDNLTWTSLYNATH